MKIIPAVLFLTCLVRADDLTQQARELLNQARAANTEEGYLKAESTLDQAVQQNPEDALAVLYRGVAKMERSGWLAQKGKFLPANEVMASACADLDRAVIMAPGNYQVRKLRGMMYSQFPAFLNKSKAGREDLEFVIHHTRFAAEEENTQAQARSLLGRLSVEHADRFPKVADDLSPLMVAATVTMPSNQHDLNPFIETLMEKIKAQPGLLGTHLLTSVDRPGMLVIMTWWKDKATLNNFFYGDVHQSLVRGRFSGTTNARPDDVPTQVGIELFSILPGGVQVNGGLIPDSVRK